MRSLRAVAAAVAGAAVVAGPVPPASATELPPAVADLDVTALDLRITPIDIRVAPIDTRVTELETETEDSAIALNSDILFGFDKDTLGAHAVEAVADVVEDIPKDASVTITGYTDDLGEDAYNAKLSTRRAKAVEDAIAKARPDLATRAEGRGSADPVEPNTKGGKDNPEGRAKNRRVEITVD